VTIEIGSLVVRGTFGTRRDTPEAEEARIEAAIDRLRQELRAELREIQREAERRRRDL
jgi:CRISPR/Cas system CSM-associated protein Csm3 (group 7 of RAMP superfamily)